MLFLSKNNTKSKHPAGCGIGPKNSVECRICLNLIAGFGIRNPPSGAPCSKVWSAAGFLIKVTTYESVVQIGGQGFCYIYIDIYIHAGKKMCKFLFPLF